MTSEDKEIFYRKPKCSHPTAKMTYTSENWPIFRCTECGKEVEAADYHE